MLESSDYVEAVQKLRPDIVLGMGDVLFGHKPGVKRQECMGDRTLAWVNQLVSGMKDEEEGTTRTAFFAPILPIEAGLQNWYLDSLQEELASHVAGLVLYDNASIDAVPKSLQHLPRLSLAELNSPHKLLDAINLGNDIFTVPFINEATDAGIALDFQFPCSSNVANGSRLPLGIDMWSSLLATDLSPLRETCGCYSCTNHHRAFVQHLLNAKEMLGWVLLQIHNHHIMNAFFAGVRQSIREESFEVDRACFGNVYVADLPAKTGQGPR